MLEDGGGGGGAGARELPPRPCGEGQVDVEQQHGPGLGRPVPDGDPEDGALDLDAAVARERPQLAQDAAAGGAPLSRAPRGGGARVGRRGRVVGEGREGHGAARGEGAGGERADGSGGGVGGWDGDDRAEEAGQLPVRGRGGVGAADDGGHCGRVGAVGCARVRAGGRPLGSPGGPRRGAAAADG